MRKVHEMSAYKFTIKVVDKRRVEKLYGKPFEGQEVWTRIEQLISIDDVVDTLIDNLYLDII